MVAVLGKSGVVCVDMAGKELWRAPTGTMSANRRWGSAASPVIVGDMVVVNAAEEARAVIALDLATGKVRWKAEGSSLELCYATPLLARNPAGEDELILGVPNEIWSIRPATGKLRWHLEAPLPGNVSPSPAAGDGIVLVQGGYPATALVAAPLGGKGALSRDAIRWQTGAASYVPSGLVSQGLFHCVTDKGQAICLEAATGKMVYQERLDIRGAESRSKPVYASVVLADGRLFATTRRAGVFVFPAGRAFSRPAVMRLGGDEDFSATPAVRETAFISGPTRHSIAYAPRSFRPGRLRAGVEQVEDIRHMAPFMRGVRPGPALIPWREGVPQVHMAVEPAPRPVHPHRALERPGGRAFSPMEHRRGAAAHGHQDISPRQAGTGKP